MKRDAYCVTAAVENTRGFVFRGAIEEFQVSVTIHFTFITFQMKGLCVTDSIRKHKQMIGECKKKLISFMSSYRERVRIKPNKTHNFG